MLPFGHAAAGALLGDIAAPVWGLDKTTAGVIGAFFGSLPDIDLILFELKYKSLSELLAKKSPKYKNHRHLPSHSPLFWFLVTAVVWFFIRLAYPSFSGFAGVMFLGLFSHFVLDSFDYGIMWFWPFSKRVYSLYNREKELEFPTGTLLFKLKEFLRLYSKTFTFKIEVLILILFFVRLFAANF